MVVARLGEIVAEDARITFGVAVVCCVKVTVLVNPVGVVKVKVYALPEGPGGTVNEIAVVEIELIRRGRFRLPVLKEILL
jgi:hypothetical protein